MVSTPQTRPMMTIQESVRTCIRKYADFSGRATRAEYWWWVLATLIVSFALGAIDGFVNSISGYKAFSPLSVVFGIAVLLPDLAVTCRRLHDIGKSGWWQLLWFIVGIIAVIPLVVGIVVGVVAAFAGDGSWESLAKPEFWIPVAAGILVAVVIWIGLVVWWLVWMAKQGQPGPNRYGPDPRAWDDDAGVEQSTA